MRIIVNDEARETGAETLETVLAEMDFATMKIATAVNGSFVPAPMRGETRLTDGDRIEIVAPMQGG